MRAGVITLCFLVTVPVRGGDGTLADPPLEPTELLARMARAYQTCRSYRDTGVAIINMRFGTEERRFRTAFVRPDKFRFEFSDRGKSYIIWRNGSQVRTRWDLGGGTEAAESLDHAIAGATGVSGRTAHTIPALLMPAEIAGRRLYELTDLTRLPAEELGLVPCFRVHGRVAGSTQTIWVDKGSFLVRRIDESLPPGLGTRITTYEPVLNGDVTDSLLAFTPGER